MTRRRTWHAIATMTLAVIGCGKSNTLVNPPPPLVRVSLPLRKSVTTYKPFTGITKAVASVELRARVKGVLQQKLFDERKNEVKKDDLLMVIEEETYKDRVDQAQAKLDEARAALAKAQTSKAREVAAAQLALDEAALLLARIEETRQRNLVSRNAASAQDVDRAEANTKKAKAQVDSDEASLAQSKSDYDVNILSAKAAVEGAEADLGDAKLNLSYCRITAPVTGRISRTSVDVGNLVGDGQATVLATIVTDQPIYVYMTISEADLLEFKGMVAAGEREDFRDVDIPLELGLSDEKGPTDSRRFPHRGRVDYCDPAVDPVTGTAQARGIFENPTRKIIPGLFVRVRVPFEDKPNALLVPERAIVSEGGLAPNERVLLVVGPGDVAKRRVVRIGSQVDEMRIIESGLKPDDRVIVDGLQKARDDQKVNPQPIDDSPPSAPLSAKASPSH